MFIFVYTRYNIKAAGWDRFSLNAAHVCKFIYFSSFFFLLLQPNEARLGIFFFFRWPVSGPCYLRAGFVVDVKIVKGRLKSLACLLFLFKLKKMLFLGLTAKGLKLGFALHSTSK